MAIEKSIKAKPPSKAVGARADKSTKGMQPKKASKTKAAPKNAKEESTFTLHAPEATRVFVAGCFNGWSPTANPLEHDRDGTWSCAVLLEPGEYEYRFVVDDVWRDDPLNLRRRQTEFGCENCILIV